jgi:hypothetical protein
MGRNSVRLLAQAAEAGTLPVNELLPLINPLLFVIPVCVQYQPKALDKFVLNKGISDNLKKLVSSTIDAQHRRLRLCSAGVGRVQHWFPRATPCLPSWVFIAPRWRRGTAHIHCSMAHLVPASAHW